MSRGRPRSFDPDEVLDKAMRVFWKRGFEGASLADLEEATCLTRPSLYAAFGDKESLFAKSLAHYVKTSDFCVLDDMADPAADPEAALRLLLSTIADFASCPTNPGGCFMVNCLVDTATGHDAARSVAQDAKNRRRADLTSLFKGAVERGVLKPGTDSVALADYFLAQIYALALMGRAGDSKEIRQHVIDTALQVLRMHRTDAAD